LRNCTVKQAVSIPVIGSLNGYTSGGWIDYARQIEQAGADAGTEHLQPADRPD
jgi:dihydroorotate dehydrogenase (fumarate)